MRTKPASPDAPSIVVVLPISNRLNHDVRVYEYIRESMMVW